MNYAVYWRILGYVRRYPKALVTCLALSLLISILHFSFLGMIKPLGDILFNSGGYEPLLKELAKWGDWGLWISEFLRQNVFNSPYRAIYIVMGFALLIELIKNILRFCQEYLAGYITNRAMMDISNELFVKVERLPVSYFSQEGASQISTRFLSDVPMMAKGLRIVLEKLAREPLKALATIVLALIINWELTIVTCLILPLSLFFITGLAKRIKRNARKALEQRSTLMAILQESFTGIRLVKAYQMEQRLFQKFTNENKKLFRSEMRVVAIDASVSPILEVFIILASMGVIAFSSSQIISGKMSIGDFAAFFAALGALFDPIRKLADINNLIGTAIAGGERVFDLMDTTPSIQDHPNAQPLPPIKNDIRFENVSFGYQTDKLILKDLNFSVRYGEKIAIVGRSGAGKSTLMSLLLRLYDTNHGTIYFDGHDIRQVTLASLLSQIGLVTQEAFLFFDTMTGNICCAKSEVPEAVVKAAQGAYAEEFIQNLTNKYETLYGPGGIDLSGGQKHRISLARAIYKEPRILILDEAMANLDAESESYILKALDTFTQNRTTFIIAHRFSTIQKVDRILVLDDGQLVGFGTHAELIQTCAVYQNLYERQIIAELPH